MPYSRFEQRLNDLPDQLWSKIAKIDELKGQWIAGAKLSPQVLGRLKKSVLVTSTGASTRIEGARLSDGDVEKLMAGIALQRFSDRDKSEVKGYFELLRNIFEAWATIPFSESSIKHLHKELLKYAGKDEGHRGEYKKKENKVMMVDASGKPVGTIFETTPAYLTPKEMQELIEWARNSLAAKKHHPLLIIGNFIIEFLNIHPFEDGNGRLARILTNLLMLKEGYLFSPYVSHEKLIESDKPGYYLALRKSQRTFNSKHENITHWLTFFLEVVFTQAKQAVSLLSTENIEKLLSPKQLAIWRYLLTVEEATPQDISKYAKVARPTVNQALSRLLSFKKIERLGLGRSTRYRKLG
ncbi:MAG: Fic family protein [Candidatus Margulisbacteria bacterium]|nr:Fic family protein [Candidatus Margulisiibacteriota bacterium]